MDDNKKEKESTLPYIGQRDPYKQRIEEYNRAMKRVKISLIVSIICGSIGITLSLISIILSIIQVIG